MTFEQPNTGHPQTGKPNAANPFFTSLRRVPVEQTRTFMQARETDDTNLRPYEFGYDMAAAEAEPSLRPIRLTQGELDAMIAAAEERGREAGLIEGRTDHEAQQRDRVETAVAAIANSMAEASSTAQATLDAHAADAAELAFVTGRTLAAHLIAREPHVEILGLLEENVDQLRAMPHLILRVEPELCETLQPLMEGFASRHGLDHPPMVMPDRDVAWGNARIDWGDGAIVRDHDAALSKMEAAVRSYAREAAARASGTAERTSLLDSHRGVSAEQMANAPAESAGETLEKPSDEPALKPAQTDFQMPDLNMEPDNG
ncbi:MAG: hypothetical protein AAF141_05160 [Pseudomonadota bacterium]